MGNHLGIDPKERGLSLRPLFREGRFRLLRGGKKQISRGLGLPARAGFFRLSRQRKKVSTTVVADWPTLSLRPGGMGLQTWKLIS